MKRKAEEVKERIFGVLWLRPLTIQEMSKKIDSNWLTVEKFVKELEEEGKIREVISTDKLKLYQKVNEDTYYSIPLTKEDREMFRFIFSTLLKEYRKRKKTPNKTELAKAVVEVVKEADVKLPVVWYLYGQIPLMIADPQKDYSTPFNPENHEKFARISEKVVNSQKYKNTKELKLDHYEKNNKELYTIKEKLIQSLKNKDTEEVLELFSQLYVACPINQDEEMFFLVDKLCIAVRKLKILRILEDNIIFVALALDSLWKYMALNQMIYSLVKNKKYNKEEIMQFYFNPIIEIKKYAAKESIQNLESIYKDKLDKFDPESVELSEGAEETRKIMEDWIGED